jgi:hypothetical protein
MAFIGLPWPKNAAGIWFLASLVAVAVTIEAFLGADRRSGECHGWMAEGRQPDACPVPAIRDDYL